MTGLMIWLRRTTARTMFPAMVAVTLAVLFSRSGWAWDLGHAVSWASSSTLLLGPLSAGVAAFDMWRQRGRGLRSVERSALRGWQGTLTLAVAVWTYAALAWATAMALAISISTFRYEGSGLGTWWPVLIQAPAALLGATLLGAVIGSLVRGVGAAPLAVGAVYTTTAMADIVLGTRSVLAVEGATMSLVGLRPRGDVLAVTLALDLVLGAAFAASVVRREHGRSRKALVSACAASLAVLACATGLVTLDAREGHLEPSTAERVCVLGDIEVCGPPEGEAIYRVAQRSLAAGISQLETAGLELGQKSYDHASAASSRAGVLSVDTALLDRDGGLDAWDVASTLSTPTLCEEFFDADPPVELLEGQWNLASWMSDVLNGAGSVAADERAAAQETLSALERCAPESVPHWSYTSAELRDAE